jgi:hypothetical protein
MGLATVVRLEFAYPGVGVLAGDSLQYLSIATAHGVIMVFFMIMPTLFGAFGNFLLPTQLGVHDVAFPRLNSAAFWFLPGGLIMLAQLVCIDRRYQRMNCFNIRELQSMLKRRFFTDLVSSNDHREMLNTTMIGLRYKTNSNNTLESDMLNFYNYGTTLSPLTKANTYESIYLSKGLSYFNYLPTTLSTAILMFIDSTFSMFDRLVGANIKSVLTSNTSLTSQFNSHYYNTVLAFDELLFNLIRVLQSFNLFSLPASLPTPSLLSEVIS